MTMPALIEAVHWFEDVCERVGLRRSYGGAIAYNYYGPPRLTQDVDVLALVPDLRLSALVDEFIAADCRHGDLDPKRVELRPVLEDLRSKAHFSVFIRQGVRIELFVPWHPFHHRVLERSPERELKGRRIRIHAAEDLIVFKKIFDRPKDLTDIQAILMTQKGQLDLQRIRADAKGFLSDSSWSELDQFLTANG
jgi:hypothetical protein